MADLINIRSWPLRNGVSQCVLLGTRNHGAPDAHSELWKILIIASGDVPHHVNAGNGGDTAGVALPSVANPGPST